MAEQKQKKGLLNGKMANLASTLKNVLVTAGEGFYQKNKPRYILTIPKNKPIGKRYYTVNSHLDPVTFAKRKDAEAFKKLLANSINPVKGDIVRREITEEGYIPLYGEQ